MKHGFYKPRDTILGVDDHIKAVSQGLAPSPLQKHRTMGPQQVLSSTGTGYTLRRFLRTVRGASENPMISKSSRSGSPLVEAKEQDHFPFLNRVLMTCLRLAELSLVPPWLWLAAPAACCHRRVREMGCDLGVFFPEIEEVGSSLNSYTGRVVRFCVVL